MGKKARKVKSLFLFFAIILFIFYTLIFNPVYVLRNVETEVKPNKDLLKKHVEFLAKIEPFRTNKNLDSLNQAADYIEFEFSKLNCSLWTQNYRANGNNYKNITCAYGSPQKPLIIVAANYDAPENSPGADDNASGAAGILELARMISIHKPKITKRVVFIVYPLEEGEYFNSKNSGSAKYTKILVQDNFNVDFAIILDSIGYFSNKQDSQNYPLDIAKHAYPRVGNYILITGRMEDFLEVRKVKTSMDRVMDLEVRSVNTPTGINGMPFTYKESYWSNNINAITITDTGPFRNKNYHKIEDTYDRLDYDKMSEVINGLYNAIIDMQDNTMLEIEELET